MGGMPLSKKIIGGFFCAAFFAVGIFFAARAVYKPNYEAREERQCDLLAMSSLIFFINETERSPGMWNLFEEDEIVLTIDHRVIPGNWNIKLTANRSRSEGTLALRADASSGWNSRAPKSAARHALLFDLNSNNIRVSSHESAEFVVSPEFVSKGKVLSFTYPNEKAAPVKIEALITEFEDPEDDHTYLILISRNP